MFAVWFECEPGGYGRLFVSRIPTRELAERIACELENEFPTREGDVPGVHRAWVEED